MRCLPIFLPLITLVVLLLLALPMLSAGLAAVHAATPSL